MAWSSMCVCAYVCTTVRRWIRESSASPCWFDQTSIRELCVPLHGTTHLDPSIFFPQATQGAATQQDKPAFCFFVVNMLTSGRHGQGGGRALCV